MKTLNTTTTSITSPPPPYSNKVSEILGAILVIIGIIMITFTIIVCLKKRQSR